MASSNLSDRGRVLGALVVGVGAWIVIAASASTAEEHDDTASPQTVQNVTIEDPTEPTTVAGLPDDFDVTFTTEANHVLGRYRATISLEGPEDVELAVRTVPLPVVGWEPAETTQTEAVTVPEDTQPGLYTLCVHVEENWPPGSDSWGFDGTGCQQDVILVEGIVDSVEFTQVTQELQDLDDLEADGPEVPVVEGRPAVMRVYAAEVDEVTTLRVDVEGSVTGSRTIELSPDCTPEKRRQQQDGCRSHDFGFTPDGDVDITLTAFDGDDNELDSRTFEFATTEVEPLRVRPVSVCDDFDGTWPLRDWHCADHTELAGLIGFTRATFPGEVTIESAGSTVRNATDDADGDWWSEVLSSVRSRWVWSLPPKPSDRYYYGMVRGEAGTGTGTIGLAYRPGHAGTSRATFTVGGQDGAPGVVAHELGHNFGRQHVPSTASGCFGSPSSIDPGWPHGLDSEIQEVGFDRRTNDAVSPDDHYDYMSYCLPMWVSPYTYQGVLEEFAVGASSSSSARATATETGEFWLVSGTILDGEVELDPLFRHEVTADTGPGEGQYHVEVRDGAGDTLVSRAFDPDEPEGQDLDLAPSFVEWVPVQAGAATIVVFDPDGVEQATVELVGEAPTVEVTSPGAGDEVDGLEVVEWSVDDPDSDTHTFVVHYSPDEGASWETVATGVTEDGLGLDFAGLAGSETTDSSRVRVLASDGVNTGTGVSEGFTVPRGEPEVGVVAPDDGEVVRGDEHVWLQGFAFDPEDGALTGDAVRWTSDRDGALGEGQEVSVALSEGVHELTVTGTDRDGNTDADRVTVIVDGTDPGLTVDVGPGELPAGPGDTLVVYPRADRSVSASIETSLMELGVDFDTQLTTDFGAVDFGSYDTVIVGLDADSVEPVDVGEADVAALRQALDAGTEVVLFGGNPSQEFVDAVDEYLVEVNTEQTDWRDPHWREPDSPHLEVVDDQHRLAWQLPATHDFETVPEQARNPSEYLLRVTDPDVSVAAVNGDGYPMLASAEDGSLIIAPQTPWGALWGAPADTALLTQMLANALEVDPVLAGPVQVTVDADDARSGLDQVAYSLDGGQEWTELAPDELPTTLTLFDSGPVQLVARANDVAGNQRVDGETFVVGPTSPLESVGVVPQEASLFVGETTAFSAAATYGNGASDDVTGVAAWSSDDPGVATVDDAGVATAVGAGDAEVAAVFKGASDAATVTVTVPEVVGLEISPAAVELDEGEQQSLTATATLEDGSTEDVTDTAAWSSDDAGVVTVDDAGVVTAVGAGEAEVSAVFDGASDVAAVTVTAPEVADPEVTEPEVVDSEASDPRVARLAGIDRIATAIAVSRDAFGDAVASSAPAADPRTPAESVVLARAGAFADALAGTPLAVARDAPVLLTPSDGVDPRVMDEIDRVLDSGATVYLLGGTAALSEEVERQITDAGFNTERLAGSTRIETSVEIAEELDRDAVLITTGFVFPDALAAGAAAAASDAAVVLTTSGEPHPALDAALDRWQPATRIAVGGPAARAYPEMEAIAGSTREWTAVEVATELFDGPRHVGLARRDAFPDALAGGAHIARRGGPVLLTPSGQLHRAPSHYVCARLETLHTGYVYGGGAALADTVQQRLAGRLNGEGC